MDITIFNGEKPKIKPISLNKDEASNCVNCYLTSSGIDQLKENKTIEETGYADIKTIFDFEDSEILVTSDKNLSFVNSPIIDDKHNRLYYTDNEDGGLYVAKKEDINFSSTPTVIGNARRAGIEYPDEKPTVIGFQLEYTTKDLGLGTNPIRTTVADNILYVTKANNSYNSDAIYAYGLFTKIRIPEKDIDLTGLNHDFIMGIWSDGIVIRVFFKRFNDVNFKVAFYDLTTKVKTNEMEISEPSASNFFSGGIWSDGTTMWLVARDFRKIFAYDIENGNRDEGKDYDFTADVPTSIFNPGGIYSDNDTFWIAGADKLYGYTIQTPWDLVRNENKDIDINTDNFVCISITGIDNYIYVAGYNRINSSKSILVFNKNTLTRVQNTIIETDPTTYDDVTSFVYTYVNDIGEESSPSPPSRQVYYTRNEELTINLSVSDDTTAVKRNIYFEFDGEYHFIYEIENNTETEVIFNIGNSNVGYLLATQDYDLPHKDLKGLILATNGILVAFFDNNLCFSEPYQPNAFPIKYRKKLRYKILAIKTIYRGIVVLTEGRPSIFIGTTPENMTETIIKTRHSSLTFFGCIEYENKVIYTSNDGLIFISGEVQNITENIFSREQWQSFNPSTMKLGIYEDKILCFYEDDESGFKKCFLIDLRTQTISRINFSETVALAYYQLSLDRLLIVIGESLQEFNAGENNLVSIWESKKFIKSQAMTINTARIDADGYPVKFRLKTEGKEFEKQVNSNKLFRVGDNWRKLTYSVELQSSNRVNALFLEQDANTIL